MVATTAAAQGGGRRFQLGQRVLPGIDGGDDVVHRGVRGRCDGGFAGVWRGDQIGGERNVLPLADGDDCGAVGLDLHTGTSGGDDFGIGSNAHAFTDGGEGAVGTLDPGLAREMGDENGGWSSHGVSINAGEKAARARGALARKMGGS
nr:hypothetical protein [Comamonas sp. SCN 65-56]